MALCTQTDVEHLLQADISVEPDPVVTTLITLATGMVRDHLGYDPEAEDDVVEVHDPTGTAHLWVRRPPIRAIVSITVDGTALTEGVDEDFVWYPAGSGLSGLIRRRGTVWRGDGKPQSIVVTYDAGYNPTGGLEPALPSSIRAACAEAVANAFRAGVRALVGGGDTLSEQIGSYQVSYASDSEGLEFGRYLRLAEDQTDKLDPYSIVIGVA